MSYILNALRRSEQERQAEQAPNLEKTLLAKQTQRKSWKFLLICILLAINLLTLIMFFWLYRQNSVRPPVADASKLATETRQQAAKTETATASQKLKAAPLPKKWVVEKSPSFSEIIAQRKTRQSQHATKPISEKKSAGPAIENAKNSQMVSPSKAPPIQHNSTNETTDRVADIPQKTSQANRSHKRLPPKLRQPPKKTAHEKPSKHSSPSQSTEKTQPVIPYLDDLTAEFRRSVPELHINVFVYSDNPEERFIMVDMAKYKTGQKIAEGVQLKKIERDNLVVEYGGKTFRIERP